MEARIFSIARYIFTQMNFSTSTKDPKDYMKLLQHGILNTMLLREFNRGDNYLCSSYFQPMDPADLTCEKMIGIVNRLCTNFRFGSLRENHFRCLIFIHGPRYPCHPEVRLRLLSILGKKPDVKKSRRRPESAGGLLTASVQLERT
ncbi:hypothetical protein ACTXT7_017468 [Hymenolepis weldensis]